MPQCIVRYWEAKTPGYHPGASLDGPCVFTPASIAKLGHAVRPLIAEACTTFAGPEFTEDDIEWIPVPYRDGTLGVSHFAIELRTIGYSARKTKLDREGTRKLKEQIIPHLSDVLVKNLPGPWLWVQWIDPNGHHV